MHKTRNSEGKRRTSTMKHLFIAGNVKKRNRIWLVLAAAILLVLVVSSFLPSGCRVSEEDLEISLGNFTVIVREEGYDLITYMNITNRAPCEVHLSAVEVRSSSYVYNTASGEASAALDSTDVEPLDLAIKPNETGVKQYAFEPHFAGRPIELTLQIVLRTAEGGSVTVFQGVLPISKSAGV